MGNISKREYDMKAIMKAKFHIQNRHDKIHVYFLDKKRQIF